MGSEPEYYDAMIEGLELIWGRGFMAPGGEGNIDHMVRGLDLRGRRLLDLGCGLGGPALLLAGKCGAEVVGIDIDERLVDIAKQRAVELGSSPSVSFEVVEPGTLPFEEATFDVVFISGAMTQVEDKRGLLTQCLRVLRPGGWVTCYDWMRCEERASEPYSEAMTYWFELEGLTYAMATPAEQLSIIRAVGFQNAEVDDRSDWYRVEARREYEEMRTTLYPRLLERVGREEAEHFVESWRAMVVVCETGEMLQVYSRGRKPSSGPRTLCR